jgi:uncharacterized protein YggE
MRAPLALLLLIPAVIDAQTTRDSVIAVNATRTVRVVPDRASLFVTVEGTAETSRDALARADTKLVAVLAALRALGDGVELGTAVAFSVAPTPGNRGFPGAPSTSTLTARTAVRVTVSRLAQLARTFAAASDAGAASTSALTFEFSAADSVRRAEVAAALVTARQEAEAIASALGGRIGGIVDISTTSSDRGFQQPAMLPMEGMMGQPVYAPEVMLSVSVTARFRIVR